MDDSMEKGTKGKDEEEISVLLDLLQQIPIREGRRVSWFGGGPEMLLSRNGREAEFERRMGAVNFSQIWKAFAPSKARIMAWRLLRNRLPTQDNIHKRLASSTVERMCCCCMDEEETAQHLFMGCPRVQDLWNKMLL